MLLKKPTFYLALIGVAVTAHLVVKLHGQSPLTAPPIEPAAKPYVVSVAASGIIEAMSDNVSIGVPSAGLVTQVHVKVADTVKAGQPLFTLDNRELAAQLRVDEANVAVSSATLKRLQDQLALLHGIKDPRAVSREEVRTRENDVSVAEAQLDAAKAKVAQDKSLIDRLIVTAPKDGTVLQVNIRPGEYASVSPKSAAMILGDLGNLQVRADVDEQNAVRLEAGQNATAYLKGDSASPIELRFVRIEPYVIPKVSLTGASTERVDTRVLQVIYTFQRPANRAIYVGQQVDVFVNSSEGKSSSVAQSNKSIAQKTNS